MIWLCTASSRSVRASSAPIWRLKPTMSVNMIAASRRFSDCTVLLGSFFIGQDYSAGVVELSTVHRSGGMSGMNFRTRSNHVSSHDCLTIDSMTSAYLLHLPELDNDWGEFARCCSLYNISRSGVILLWRA